MIRWLALAAVAICAPTAYLLAIYLGDAWEIERVQAEPAAIDVVLPLMPPLPPPPRPPPAPPSGPRSVSPHQLHRVSGQVDIQPPEATRTAMIAAGKHRLIGTFKMCLDTIGRVSEVTRIDSTGYDAYDRRLWAAMWNWRYLPFMADGRPIEVCTAITFAFEVR
jgi:hypothetical protein